MTIKFFAYVVLAAVAAYGQRSQALVNQLLTKPVIYAYTVATLPTSGGGLTVGAVATVTDAATAGSCTVGGGSALALCRWSGSLWVSLGGAAGSADALTQAAEYTAANAVSVSAAGSGRAVVQTPLRVDPTTGAVSNTSTGPTLWTLKDQSADPDAPGADKTEIYTLAGVPKVRAGTAGAARSIATTDQLTTNPVTAAAVIATGAVAVGDDGARGVAASTLNAAVTKMASGVPSAATSAEVGGLFTGGSTYLKADGTTGAGGGGITTGTTIPATCAEGEYYDHQSARARALFRCGANNHWFVVSNSPKDWILNEEFKNGSGDPTLTGDDRGLWMKDGTNSGVPTWAVGGTYPNLGTVAIPTGASSGDQAIAKYRGFGTSGIAIGDLAHTFYFVVTFKLSRATNIKALVGFQDGASGFLQYHEFVGLRYEAAGSAGVFKFTCQSSSTTYSGITTVSTITADANYHSFRVYRVNAGTLYMSVDGEAPVTVATTNLPANNETPYIGIQSDTTSIATLYIDRAFLWLGTAR